MATDSAIELVQGAYAALEADDTAALLRLWADDATIEYPAAGQLAYGGTWSGREGMVRFLELHDETEEIMVFEPGPMVAGAETVFVQGFFRGRSRLTGRIWETKWVHIFTHNGIKLRGWLSLFDTAAALEAHRP